MIELFEIMNSSRIERIDLIRCYTRCKDPHGHIRVSSNPRGLRDGDDGSEQTRNADEGAILVPSPCATRIFGRSVVLDARPSAFQKGTSTNHSRK